MADRLFVYGTLHPDRAPSELSDLVRGFKRIGNGTIRGRRYDLGEYPAVVLDQRAGRLQGEVYLVQGGSAALSRLDAYEEYKPSEPAKSLFLRKKIKVTLDDGTRSDCWIYVYNRPIPSAFQTSDLASVA